MSSGNTLGFDILNKSKDQSKKASQDLPMGVQLLLRAKLIEDPSEHEVW